MTLRLPTPDDLTVREEQSAAARIALDRVLSELGVEELEVLTMLARRLHAGQLAYGLIDVCNDRRDFEEERGEELADALVYTAMAELKRLKRRERVVMRRIKRNSAKCLKCNTEIESVHRHDFVTCPCGNVSVDGGRAYLKRACVDRQFMDDTSVVERE